MVDARTRALAGESACPPSRCDNLLNMRVLLTVLFTAVAYAQPNAQTPLARLEGNIQRITKSVNANWGIYIKCLETGETVELNADQQMDTMSVIKIPLMAEVFRQLEAGCGRARA
jgi:beta-lactamase class A